MNNIDVLIRPVLRHFSRCSSGSALIYLIMAGIALAFIFPAAAADTNAPRTAQDTNSEEVLRAYLQLQEQLHATQLAVEQNRREYQEAAAQNEEALANRLRAIEQALAAQRSRELDAMQSSNRVMLIVAGSFAVVGFVAMLIMAYFQWRTVNGLAELSATLPAGRALGFGGGLPALGTGELHIGNPAAAEQSNARLLGALGQLEKRLYELEHAATTHTVEATGPTKSGNGDSNGNGHSLSQEHGAGSSAETATGDAGQIRALLVKGESLLDRNEAEAALACFDELLALAPNHAEGLVKKGAALEKLQKPTEAIACYDRAIATDASMTIAYLHKGGLCNRLERFNDALQCYEQALRTQEKRKA
jgi:tetratricopeptide (TPR) repeat protein